ncbi:Nectin-4, partial [Eudyptes sclateri]
SGVVEVERSVTVVLGQDVVLPCRYRTQEQEQVVQVTWLKRGPAGQSAEVAVLNRQHGEHVQEPYAGRVVRPAGGALEDGAIVLRNAVQGDEGDYECHLITFPLGSFEGHLTLKVLGETWGLGHVGDMEGIGGRWHGGLWGHGGRWGEMKGTGGALGTWGAQQDHGDMGTVPARPLTVPLSPDLSDASVLGHTEEWQEGMEGATLTCLGDGNPPPTYNWTRLNAPLPDGVRVKGDTLVFQRPLAAADAGEYVCHVSNRVATKEARANVSIKGRVADNEVRKVDLVSASVVVVGVIAAVLLCVLVPSHLHAPLHARALSPRAPPCTRVPGRAPRQQPSAMGVPGDVCSSAVTPTGPLSPQSEEPEGRSYSTLSTVREIETQTEVPAAPLLPAPVGKEPKEEEEDGGGGGGGRGDDPIKQAMTHFVQENGMLQAKPTTNGIYINGRGHLV